MQHDAPIRCRRALGGATAAVSGAPSANVLVLTHSGFLPRRAGPARLGFAGPPATACPHDPHPGRPTPRTRPAEPMAGTNLDKGRRLGRRPHRRPDRITGATNAGCHTTLASQCHPRLPAAVAGRPARNLPRHSTIAVGQPTLVARLATATPRSLGSAALQRRSRATRRRIQSDGRGAPAASLQRNIFR